MVKLNLRRNNNYQSLSTVVEKFILKKCSESNISKIEVKLLLNWQNIVGKEIAKFATPEKLVFKENSNSGVLHILVNNSGAALNLQYMIPTIIEQITVFLGYKAVYSIKIKQRSC